MSEHNFYKTSNHVYVEDDGQVYVMKIGKNSKWNNIQDDHVIEITDSGESSGDDVMEVPLRQNVETQTETYIERPSEMDINEELSENDESEEEIHPFEKRSPIIYESDEISDSIDDDMETNDRGIIDSETMYTSENEDNEEESMGSFIVSDDYTTSSLEESE